MLTRALRVRKEDFESIIKKGAYIQSPFFTVRFLLKEGKSNFAVVVSKTVSKSAVSRNKIKRRIWGVISKNQNFFRDGYNIIFFAKKASEKVSYKELEDLILNSLKNSKLQN